ncbi:MAG TPA: DUF885 domain-containing protein [Candidatus Eisenbacteria bacterium]
MGTRLGLHDRDGELSPVTEATVAEDVAWLAEFRARLAQVPRAELSFDRALDRDLLASRLASDSLELNVIRPSQTDPGFYLDQIVGSVESLLDRDFASICERTQAAARRLSAVPEVLRAAKINLKNPAPELTEAAIDRFSGALRFYRGQVAALSSACHEARRQADLAEADSLAVEALSDFLSYLRDDLRPRSHGSWALGEAVYQRRLGCEEQETAPLDTLLARGWAALEDHRRRLEQVAERIAPGRGLRAALDSLEHDRPQAWNLVTFMAAGQKRVRSFLQEQDLVSLPAVNEPSPRETPPHRSGLDLVALDAPGVREARLSDAYYEVMPADSGWTEPEKRDHLAFFSRPVCELLVIHETLPGRYLELLARRRISSRLRQLLPATSAIDGWADYCEQMMLEAGYGGPDPRYEMAELRLALGRIGRLVAGLSLHTRGMTYAEAVRLLEERCVMPRVHAELEVRRLICDPLRPVSTLGLWRILQLRVEMQRRLGPDFRLKDFHDLLLRQAGFPLPLARAAILRRLGTQARGRSGSTTPARVDAGRPGRIK